MKSKPTGMPKIRIEGLSDEQRRAHAHNASQRVLVSADEIYGADPMRNT